jgi:hypothetical protein
MFRSCRYAKTWIASKGSGAYPNQQYRASYTQYSVNFSHDSAPLLACFGLQLTVPGLHFTVVLQADFFTLLFCFSGFHFFSILSSFLFGHQCRAINHSTQSILLPVHVTIHVAIHVSVLITIMQPVHVTIHVSVLITIMQPVHVAIHVSVLITIMQPVHVAIHVSVLITIMHSVHVAIHVSVLILITIMHSVHVTTHVSVLSGISIRLVCSVCLSYSISSAVLLICISGYS